MVGQLPQNISKSIELITVFREKEAKTHTPVDNSGAEVEPGNQEHNLSWPTHISNKAQEQL